MRSPHALALVVIGVLAVAGGWYFGTAQQPGEQQAYNGGKLMFPDLAPKLQDAARIEITHQGKTTAIVKHGDAWGLEDRGGYVVQASKLRGMLTALTELRLVEQRTTDPEQFNRLGLEDPNGKDRNIEPAARARRVRQADRRADRRPSPRAHAGQCAGAGLCPPPGRQPDLARRGQPSGGCRPAAMARPRHHEHRPCAHRRAWR